MNSASPPLAVHCLHDGVEGVSDRHDYLREKQDAFDRLATLVERIINPPSDKYLTCRAV
jgi:hypothetical protein